MSRNAWCCVVMLACLVVGAVAASDVQACTGMCVLVASATGESCMECVDTGTYTGVTCWRKGPCTCFERLCPPPPGEAVSESLGSTEQALVVEPETIDG